MAWRNLSRGRKAALTIHWIIAAGTAVLLIRQDFICSIFPGRSVFSMGIVCGWLALLFFEERQRVISGKDFTGALNLFVVMLITFLEIVLTPCERRYATEMTLTLLLSLFNFVLYYWPEISERFRKK